MLSRSTRIGPSLGFTSDETAAGLAGGWGGGGHLLSSAALLPESDTMHVAVQPASLGARENLHEPLTCEYCPVRLPAARHSELELAIAMADRAVSGAFAGGCCAQPNIINSERT